MATILQGLGIPAGEDQAQEVALLRRYLQALENAPTDRTERYQALDLIHARTLAAIAALPALLGESGLPLSRRARARVKGTQDLAELLARTFLATLDSIDAGPGLAQEALLWKIQHLLERHLFISALVAAPAAVGIWELSHRAYGLARERQLHQATIPGTASTIEQEYAAALLLNCAQPASFSAQELKFIADLIQRHGQLLEFLNGTDERHHGLFWVNPKRDTSAVAITRRLPPPETPVLWFSCDRLARHLRLRLKSLEEQQASATDLDLPDFAATLAGRSVLRRIIEAWGNPARRRFPRRRQSYRAKLHVGLEALTGLLRHPDGHAGEGSTWMITNESPDGYALMHLAGSAGRLEVGDVVALKPENPRNPQGNWQACMVRWALSENPEHLEIGLQILAPSAYPTTIGLFGESPRSHAQALLLPAIAGVRPKESLLVACGALPQGHCLLVVEKDNLEIREVRLTGLEEQTNRVEIFALAPEEMP